MTPDAPASPPAEPQPPVPWQDLADEQLLDVRLCDLPLAIDGTWLTEQIERLCRELETKGIVFRPHFWLSDDWFSPDGVGGIAIPFYLAHPRLARLENAQMLEVEGGTPEWCIQIMRHEAGHAIDNAFALRRRRSRQKLFGKSSTTYPEFYTPKPYSKSFVLHLDPWYAQSHPDEDFAETFAVWLTPEAMWDKRYADWPALRKLTYMDTLMSDIAGKPPVVGSRRKVDPLSSLRKTLRQHYRRKREHHGLEHPHFYDRDLRRLFTDAPSAGSTSAARFIAGIRKDVRRRVASWTGEYQYTIDKVIEDMVARCRELNLRLAGHDDQARLEFIILVTVQTMNYLHSGRHRVAL